MYRLGEIFILPLFGFVYHNAARVYYDFVCTGQLRRNTVAYILLLRQPYPMCLIKSPLRSSLMVVDVIFEQPFFFSVGEGAGRGLKISSALFLEYVRNQLFNMGSFSLSTGLLLVINSR